MLLHQEWHRETGDAPFIMFLVDLFQESYPEGSPLRIAVQDAYRMVVLCNACNIVQIHERTAIFANQSPLVNRNNFSSLEHLKMSSAHIHQ